MKVKISDKAKKLIFVSALALWIAFIFSNSLQNGEQSSQMSGLVTKMLSAIFGDNIESLTYFIRKLAHFTEFAVLGVLFYLVNNSMVKGKRMILERSAFGGLVIALCDETIQLFSEGRSGQVSDVWIDFSGLLLGLTVIFLINWLKTKKNQKQKSVLEENCV